MREAGSQPHARTDAQGEMYVRTSSVGKPATPPPPLPLAPPPPLGLHLRWGGTDGTARTNHGGRISKTDETPRFRFRSRVHSSSLVAWLPSGSYPNSQGVGYGMYLLPGLLVQEMGMLGRMILGLVQEREGVCRNMFRLAGEEDLGKVGE